MVKQEKIVPKGHGRNLENTTPHKDEEGNNLNYSRKFTKALEPHEESAMKNGTTIDDINDRL